MGINVSWGILDTGYQENKINPSISYKLTDKQPPNDNATDINNKKSLVMAPEKQKKFSISKKESEDTIISDVCLYLEVPRENLKLLNPRDFINNSLEESLKSFTIKTKK